MSKPAVRHPKLRWIDVTAAARPFTIIKYTNVLMIQFSIGIIIALPVQFLQAHTTRSASIPVLVILILPFGLAGLIAFRNISVVHLVNHRFARLSLLVVAVVSGLWVFVSMAYLDSPSKTSKAVSVGRIVFGWVGVSALLSVAAITVARRARIDGLGLRLSAMLRRMKSLEEGDSAAAPPPPRHPVRAALWAIAGALWLMGMSALPDESQVPSALLLVGYLFFLFARSDLQPSAGGALKGDSRAPVLLLRSFGDDERVQVNNAGFALIDFSLETRLAAHFGRIGPFIAVGSPQEKSVPLGAARAQLSDAEWQDVVLGWIDRAQVVVLIAGITHWAGWELNQMISRSHIDKLILMMPQSQIHPIYGVAKDVVERKTGERLARIQAAFATTPYADALFALDHPERIRAMRFAPDGCVEVIVSRTFNRDSYHLAVLVAHNRILEVGSGAPDWWPT